MGRGSKIVGKHPADRPRLPGTRHVQIPADAYGNELKLLYPIPKDDPWGVFACLKGTYWGDQIKVVSGEVYSHALYGMTKPLRAAVGRPTRIDARRVPDEIAWCGKLHDGTCAMGDGRCRPGTGKLPICYWAPSQEASVSDAAASVALAWDEGRYVIVIEGEAFVV